MKGSLLQLFRFLFLAVVVAMAACATVGENDGALDPWDPGFVFTGGGIEPGIQETSPPPPDAAEPADLAAGEPEPPRPGLLSRIFQRSSDEDPPAVAPPDDESADPPMAMAEPEDLPQAYLLRVGDPVVIVLSGPGLDERVDMVIDDRGFVKLRYIGSVRAAGRTATELEREIEAEYTDRQQIYREVYATVHVPNQYYFIGGEVRQPGRYPLAGRVTLSQAIVAAGNFTEWARGDGRLTLLRNNERITIQFRDITEDPTRDIELRTGDVITVDRRGVL